MCKESKKSQNTTQSAPIPTWLEDASKGLVGKANEYADKPFEAYGGDRVADITADQSTAFQQLRDFISGGDTTKAARDAMTAPAQTVGTERTVDEGGRLGQISDYMNPYIEKALQPALAKVQETADARRKQINAGATAGHAFGDARHGILESTHDLNTSRAMGDTASQFMANAFDKTMATRAGDLNRFGDIDKTNAQFGETALNRELTGSNAVQQQMIQQIQALLGAGGIQQGTEQAGLDAQYQEFIRQFQDDPNKLKILSEALSRIPYSKTSTSNTDMIQPDNSGMALLGSAASAAASSAPVSAALASMLAAI